MMPRRIIIEWANKSFDIIYLLKEVGLDNPTVGSLTWCPFHPDKEGGKRSARIYKDALHCFSESKQYRPYDILRYLGYTDDQIEQTILQSGKDIGELSSYMDVRIDIVTELQLKKAAFMKGIVKSDDYLKKIFPIIMNLLSERNK